MTVAVDGVLNFREVAGLRTEDGRRLRRGVLYRSDTLQFVTPEGLRVLTEDLAVRTVIDLRLPYEVKVEGRGRFADVPHRYLNLPFLVQGSEQEDSAVPRYFGEDPIVRHYLGYLSTSPDAVTGVVTALAADDALPAVVHCTAGKDRTGVALAVLLAALRVQRHEIVAEYAAGADQLAAVWDQLRTLSTYRSRIDTMPPESTTSDPAYMDRFLTAVDDRYDGIPAYLTDHGLPPDTLSTLRDALTEPAA